MPLPFITTFSFHRITTFKFEITIIYKSKEFLPLQFVPFIQITIQVKQIIIFEINKAHEEDNNFGCRRRVKDCKDKRSDLRFSFIWASTKFPWESNFFGGWWALMNISGLLMKWRSRNTPICRKWACDRFPPEPPAALTMAAVFPAITFGGLDAQSIAFFNGAVHNKFFK